MPAIQWYPGHMAKTTRILSENLKNVDLVIEVLDARIPASSGNPDFDRLLAGKQRLFLLNKEDLADPKVSSLWKGYYSENRLSAIFTNLKTAGDLKHIRGILKKIGDEKVKQQASKGVKRRPVRAMVVGIPNSGKSTLINMLSGRYGANTGDKPGVTRSLKWVRLDGGIDLLDTPGILWPKFASEETALNLAYTGAIKDSITDTEEIAEKLLRWIQANYPGNLSARYKISEEMLPSGAGEFSAGAYSAGTLSPGTLLLGEFSAGTLSTGVITKDEPVYAMLDSVAKKRGFLLQGGEPDINRASVIVLDEFRAAKIGRISLEQPVASG